MKGRTGKKIHRNRKIWILLAYVILFTLLASFRLHTFQATYEFGWEERLMVNTFEGEFYFQDDQGFNSLGSHFHIVHIAVLTPLYYLFEHSAVFFFVQASMMALCALLLYHFSRKYLEKRFSDIIFYLFLSFPLVINTMLEDFHGIVYAPPLIVLLFWALDIKKEWLVYLSAVLLVLVQEDMSLVVLMTGLYFWIFRKKRMGLKVLLIGLIGFLLIPNLIQPALIDEYVFYEEGKFLHYSYKYGHLGNDLPSILETIITRPGYAFSYTPVSMKLDFLKSLFFPLLLLPLLSPAIIIAIPIILEVLLHSSYMNLCPNSYHVISLIPVLFISLILSLSWLGRRFGKNLVSTLMKLLLIIVILFLVSGEAGHWFSEGYMNDKNIFGGDACMKHELKLFAEHRSYSISRDSALMSDLRAIPEESSMLVPFHMYSNFVRHDQVKTFFRSKSCYDANYIILDEEDLYFPEDVEMQVLKEELLASGYELWRENVGITILHGSGKVVCP